jgi:hypothetical protein
MAISHTQAAQALYGSSEKPKAAAAPPAALSRDAAAKVLYRGGGPLSDQPFLGYRSRITRAKQNDDHLEASRLEAEEREVRQLAEELKLDDSQALKIVNAVRDTSSAPLSRTALLPADQLNLQKRFGPQTADIVHSAATHANKLLATKPTLLETVKRGHTWVHADVVETISEAAQALGIVKPIES